LCAVDSHARERKRERDTARERERQQESEEEREREFAAGQTLLPQQGLVVCAAGLVVCDEHQHHIWNLCVCVCEREREREKE